MPRRPHPHPPTPRAAPTGVRSGDDPRATGGPSPRARDRFLTLDAYRVRREWTRYEGTPQRDLFRQLRERFLVRHAVASGRALDIGPGPGRFTPLVGGPWVRRVALELSLEMLRVLRTTWRKLPAAPPLPELVRGDGVDPPFRAGSFAEVVAFGNPLGFAGASAEAFLDATVGMIAPHGRLLLETVAGPGEASVYLARLPPTAVRRLLASPVAALAPRVEREGFRSETLHPPRERDGFRRFTAGTLRSRLERAGFRIDEVLSVAPCLGGEPARAAAVHLDPKAWSHLLDLEERIGRERARHRDAAALLVAAVRGK
ncbi:MAG: class I SAM-dependent methyltransferase [Thermoplasmata archaeon]